MNTKPSLQSRWSLLVLAAVAAAPAFTAADTRNTVVPGAATPAGARAEVPGERRILRLTDGRVLRTIARPALAENTAELDVAGGAWEVKQSGQWMVVPRASILRVRTEREALAEYGRLARGLTEQDHVRRLALAGWLANEGLLTELLRELDRVLAADPDARQALELLRSRAVLATLPSADPDVLRERVRALREGGKALPAARELWITRLQAQDDREGLVAALGRELTQTVDTRRDFAAHALRRIAPGSLIEQLEPLALADRSRNVREEARRALRDARSPVVVERLVPRIESASLKERIGAIDTLGIAGHAAAPAAIAPLVMHLVNLAKPKPAGSGSGGTVPRSHISLRKQVAYVQDFDVEIAQAASIADPIVNFAEEGVVLDVAAATWQLPVVYQYENALTCRALTRLTGEGAERKPQEWIDWWKANAGGAASGVPAPAAPARPATDPGDGSTRPK